MREDLNRWLRLSANHRQQLDGGVWGSENSTLGEHPARTQRK